ALAAAGIPVIVLERRRIPGGRASSFRDPVTGDALDNGQHLFAGSYRRTLRLLDLIGSRDGLRLQKRLRIPFRHPERGRVELAFAPLPPPLDAAWGILRSSLLGPADRIRLLGSGIRARDRRREVPGEMTVEAWLSAAGQSPEARRAFWHPLTLAIMNEHPGAASASCLLRALRQAFLGGAGGGLGMSRIPLGDLIAGPALRFVEERGGEVRTAMEAESLRMERGRVAAVRIRRGGEAECSAAILALPWHAVPAAAEPSILGEDALRFAAAAAPSPIVSVHLWFAEDFLEEEMTGLIGRPTHWVFNLKRILGEGSAHLSTVTSAARHLAGQPAAAVAHQAWKDVGFAHGGSIPRPLRTIVIRERRATPSLSPGVELLRPGHGTRAPNLFLAGDWTQTGLPATIEGAVQSGQECAARALEWLGGTGGERDEGGMKREAP
ncbi:MAG: hydroxysqualene dehydroxylase HpnE, partial [Bacteroidota bacterium]